MSQGASVLLTSQAQALAVLGVTRVFSSDLEVLAQHVYGTTDRAHPGVARTIELQDTFLGGPVTLVNPPVITPPFDQFWKTPRQLRQRFSELG